MALKMPFTKAFLVLSLVLLLDSRCSSPQETSTAGKQETTSHRPYQDPKIFTDLLDGLLDGYDNRLRPGFGTGKPTVVNADIHVTSFGPVYDTEMEYTLDIFFRQTWKDERLKFKGPIKTLALNSVMVPKIWTPDTHFRNSKESTLHNETVPNRMLRLSEDGTLLYTMRLTITADCLLDLHAFPMDNHTCPLVFSSFGSSTDEVDLVWNEKIGASALTVAEDASRLTQYNLVDQWTNRAEEDSAFGNVAVLTANFRVERRLCYFLLQSYLPCVLTVVISQLSFWVNREAVPARVVCGVTSVLTTTTLSLTARNSLPRVSYATSLDRYICVCYGFVFLALLEFAVVNVFTKRNWAWDGGRKQESPGSQAGRRRSPGAPEEIEMQELGLGRRREEEEEAAAQAAQAGQDQDQGQGEGQGEGQGQDGDGEDSEEEKTYNSVSKVDEMSRVIFPAAFLLFNLFYWVTNYRPWEY